VAVTLFGGQRPKMGRVQISGKPFSRPARLKFTAKPPDEQGVYLKAALHWMVATSRDPIPCYF
jgi:hypothetical protein